MAPVARELCTICGVLEPLQTATSLEGQLQELWTVLKENGDPPVTLIGSSWGAMLGYIFSARYPESVKKLILIGSGVYEEQYATTIQETRLSRLSEPERREAQTLLETLAAPVGTEKNVCLARLGALFTKADAYDPLTLEIEVLEHQQELHQSVWKEAEELRSSGRLLDLGKHIQCPVVAIHGDHDPHPAQGVQEPLSAVLTRFRFILLKDCGHLPWIERKARDRFYATLKEELD
jgi:pimeloyl-ACP methyl ester carboxylesterase